MGYGTAQFFSSSSIDFWQRRKKKEQMVEERNWAAGWWNTLSHWIIKKGAPVSRIAISVRVQVQHILLISEATQYFYKKELSSVLNYDDPVSQHAIVWRGKATFCSWLNEKDKLYFFVLVGEWEEICTYSLIISEFRSEGFMLLWHRWSLFIYVNSIEICKLTHLPWQRLESSLPSNTQNY